MIIGAMGYAGSGKDQVGDFLVKHKGFVKFGMSDKLCEFALAMNPFVWHKFWWWPLTEIVQKHGWTEAKKNPRIRRYLQWLGTHGREILGEDVWVNALFPSVFNAVNEGKNAFITGIRYPNEAKMIRHAFGALILVERPGVGPVNSHHSDAGLVFDQADLIIMNNGTLEDLETEALDAYKQLAGLTEITPESAKRRMNDKITKTIEQATIFVIGASAPNYTNISEYSKLHKPNLRVKTNPDGSELYTVAISGRDVGTIAVDDNKVNISTSV